MTFWSMLLVCQNYMHLRNGQLTLKWLLMRVMKSSEIVDLWFVQLVDWYWAEIPECFYSWVYIPVAWHVGRVVWAGSRGGQCSLVMITQQYKLIGCICWRAAEILRLWARHNTLGYLHSSVNIMKLINSVLWCCLCIFVQRTCSLRWRRFTVPSLPFWSQ